MNQENFFIKDKNGYERLGVLIKLEENQHSRYEFEVWFNYTRQAMNEIKEGTMLAVPNYATIKGEIHYSILEVTSLKPIHYAIGEKPDGFPGFIMEAAKNAAQDWTGQDDEATEDTTTIRCIAIPTNLEIIERKEKIFFDVEENIPMVGSTVRILDTEPTKQVVNRDIDLEVEKYTIFEGGTLIRDENVPVFVRVEDFIQVHFGIFGFTGSGKSNLLSSYITKLLASPPVVKIILFDLMGEYSVLLLDQLLNCQQGNILTLERKTLPEGLFKYINNLKDKPLLDEAIEQLKRYTLLPKKLLKYSELITHSFQQLIEENKIKLYQQGKSTSIWELFFTEDIVTWSKKRQKTKFNERKGIVKKVIKEALNNLKIKGDYKNIKFTPELSKEIREILEKELEQESSKEFKQDQDFENHIAQLHKLEKLTQEIWKAGITLDEIIADLNDTESSSLWIIQAHSPDELRNFSKRLGEEIYEKRRQNGIVNPLVSFIFDEADEFIPSRSPNNKKSYDDSKEIVETLARRGRKFGIGFGIATQRTRYLDTSIMSQPHTYLVSKLPRESDREVVAEAFGVSKDMFRQTFKFKPGNWLLMSYDATGLKAIPVPIKTDNANDRIVQNLEKLDRNNRDKNDGEQFEIDL